MSEIVENPLALQVRDAQVSESDATMLLTTFAPFFSQAQEWRRQAAAITVTSVEDKAQMAEARKVRLAFKEIRVSVEKSRKSLKEDSLRKGKAIDGMANVIKYLIVPIEEDLEAKENYAKLQEEKRLRELLEDRAQQVRLYGFDPAVYNLAGMTQEAFDALIADCKAKDEAKQAADEKAERERIERERADAEERERVRQENVRLKAEADKERAERERVEAELRTKQEQEERAEQERQRVAREKADEERRAAMAPDRDKLVAFAAAIVATPLPEVSSPEAKLLLRKAVDQLAQVSQFLKSKAVSL